MLLISADLFLVEMTETQPGISINVQPFGPHPHDESASSIFSSERCFGHFAHVTSAMKGQMWSFFALESCDLHSAALQWYTIVA